MGIGDYSDNWLGLIGIILGSLVLITQISWWVFNRYFPSIHLCQVIHRKSSSWLASERKLLKSLESPTIFGFLSALLLVGIVPINVSILAQAFEPWVPPGDIVNIAYIGSYGFFTLIVGLLFALTELAFGALVEQKRKEEKKTFSIKFTIGMMIFVEAGLNLYRANILELDESVVAQTFLDNIVGFGGPVLAAFLGVVVPVVMILLGAYAIMDFIIPVLTNIFLLIRFFMFTALIYLGILLFGFHPQKPVLAPAPVDRLLKLIKPLKKKTKRMDKMVESVKEIYPKLENTYKNPQNIDNDVQNLFKSLAEISSSINGKEGSGKGREYLQLLSSKKNQNKRELRHTILEVKNKIRNFYGSIDSNEKTVDKLSQLMMQHEKDNNNWDTNITRYKTRLEKAEQAVNDVQQYIENTNIESFLTDLKNALQMKSVQNSLLSDREIKDLDELNAPPNNLLTEEKAWRKTIAEYATVIVQEVESELISITNTLAEHQNWLANNKLSTNGKDLHAAENFEKNLVEIENRLEILEKNGTEQFKELQTQLRELAMEQRAFWIYFKLLFPFSKNI